MRINRREFPESADLLAAVIADTDDDSPRLAYADWLEEHGDPHRAEFIRVQCALADKSPADRDYHDLVDRLEVVVDALHHREFELPLPAGFRYGSNLGCSDKAHYDRGFPYTFGPWTHGLGRKEVAQIPGKLPEVMRTNTVREMECAYLSRAQLAEMLRGPAAMKLRGLIVDPREVTLPPLDMPHLRRLRVMADASDKDVQTLTKANLERLTHLQFHPTCRVAELENLMTREWFLRLRTLHVRFNGRNVHAGLARLADLPELHSMRIWDGKLNSASQAFARSGAFSSLAHLDISDETWTTEWAADLAKAEFPRLTSLTIGGEMSWSTFTKLIGADWIGGLHVWNDGRETTCGHGPRGLQALAKSPCAKNLRNMQLSEGDCVRAALTLVGESGSFPSLTRLEIGSAYEDKDSAAEVVRFLQHAHLPRLRSLALGGWPLGEAGATALATNPSIANLTRLKLQQCPLGAKGITSLLRSSNLQKLVHFDLWGPDAARAAELLCDPAVLPELGHGHLHGGDIPDEISERLYSIRMI